MSKHTPGPWEVRPSTVGSPIIWKQGERVLAVAYAYRDYPPLECSANARLIAAAPELLELIQSFPMLMVPAKTAWGKEVQDWQEKALAVIAKAEGR